MHRRPVRSRGRVVSILTGPDSVTRTARVPSSRAMSIPILRFGWTRRRAEHVQPLAVQRHPRPVAPDPFQAGIDRTNQIVLRLVDPDTVGLGLQTAARRCAGSGSCTAIPARIESSVLTASTCPCCSATRQSSQFGTASKRCRRRDPGDGGQRRGVHLRAHPFARQVVRAPAPANPSAPAAADALRSTRWRRRSARHVRR